MPTPSTWYVAPTGSDGNDCLTSSTPCRTIVEAVSRASSGDTIEVASGLYAGAIILAKDLTLVGSGVNPVLDGNGADIVVSVAGGAVVSMRGLEIRNGVMGGVENLGTISLVECWIHDNGNGTGFSFGGVTNLGTAWIEQTTVSTNHGDASGGISNSGQLDLLNSTVANNQATFAPGILNAAGASLTARYSTVADNGTYGFRGSGSIQLEATIIAAHATANCEFAVTTIGNNLEDRDTCGFVLALGDVVGTDPFLNPLDMAGGRTPTMALQAGSPAIDAAASASCPANDQRGVSRPADGDDNGSVVCDMGAFEFRSGPVFSDGFEGGSTAGWDVVVGGP
jgi:hypothetical protein